MPRPPSITVDRNTTLTQLQEFTEGLKDSKRLRGKENEDASITLYTKDAKRGLSSMLFGHSEKYRDSLRYRFNRAGSTRCPGRTGREQSAGHAMDRHHHERSR
jgi:hypothetical protein